MTDTKTIWPKLRFYNDTVEVYSYADVLRYIGLTHERVGHFYTPPQLKVSGLLVLTMADLRELILLVRTAPARTSSARQQLLQAELRGEAFLHEWILSKNNRELQAARDRRSLPQEDVSNSTLGPLMEEIKSLSKKLDDTRDKIIREINKVSASTAGKRASTALSLVKKQNESNTQTQLKLKGNANSEVL